MKLFVQGMQMIAFCVMFLLRIAWLVSLTKLPVLDTSVQQAL